MSLLLKGPEAAIAAGLQQQRCGSGIATDVERCLDDITGMTRDASMTSQRCHRGIARHQMTAMLLPKRLN